MNNNPDWNAGNKFYDFVIQIEQEANKARNQINESNDASQIAQALDNWFESLKQLADTTHGYFDTDENKALATIEAKINKITQGNLIVFCSLSGGELKELYDCLRELKRQLSKLLSKYNMYIKTRSDDIHMAGDL